MTREQFDRNYAATTSKTEGFTAEQLSTLNDIVFADVAEIDIDDQDMSDAQWSAIQHAFERAAAKIV